MTFPVAYDAHEENSKEADAALVTASVAQAQGCQYFSVHWTTKRECRKLFHRVSEKT